MYTEEEGVFMLGTKRKRIYDTEFKKETVRGRPSSQPTPIDILIHSRLS